MRCGPISSITPFDTDPDTWDPGETAKISYDLVPAPKVGTKGTVGVVVPGGVQDSAYFDIESQKTCFYLHNDPTPPTGSTQSQTVLPMGATAATATTLYNYDTDRDTAIGLAITTGGTGVDEADPTKHQVWRSGPLVDTLVISGDITIDFWAAIKDFQNGSTGDVTFYLRDRDGTGDYLEIANGSASSGDWQGGSGTFVKKTITIPAVSYSIPVTHELEVKLIVNPPAADHMWFAYDAVDYPTVVAILPFNDTWWESSYAFRRKLTVTTGANDPSGGYDGYTVRLTGYDTASLVSAGKMRGDCNDLRVVQWETSSSAWTELNRDIISCDSASTEVSFQLQVDIAASSSDANYYLYYGNAVAGAGPNNLSSVYLWYDSAGTDQMSSYTLGRADDWHGTGYSAFSHSVPNLSYVNDTNDNFTGSIRWAVSERDAYIEAEFSHLGCYLSNMTAGLTGRYVVNSGVGATEESVHYYASNRSHQAACGAGYTDDGDTMKNARGTLAIDGTDPAAIAINQWRKQGLAVWSINPTKREILGHRHRLRIRTASTSNGGHERFWDRCCRRRPGEPRRLGSYSSSR